MTVATSSGRAERTVTPASTSAPGSQAKPRGAQNEMMSFPSVVRGCALHGLRIPPSGTANSESTMTSKDVGDVLQVSASARTQRSIWSDCATMASQSSSPGVGRFASSARPGGRGASSTRAHSCPTHRSRGLTSEQVPPTHARLGSALSSISFKAPRNSALGNRHSSPVVHDGVPNSAAVRTRCPVAASRDEIAAATRRAARRRPWRAWFHSPT